MPAADCPADLLDATVVLVRSDAGQGLTQVERLLGDYPRDARLHFLRGSLLASAQRYDHAQAAMAAAVGLAPAFALARFQLGLLQLTSRDPAAAKATWAPLLETDAEGALPAFARGLACLSENRFDEAARLLKAGLALNHDNPALSAEMTLILDGLERAPGQAPASAPTAEAPVSAAHLLLQQYSTNATRH